MSVKQADNFLLTKQFHSNLARDIRQELGEQEPPTNNQTCHFWDFDDEESMKQQPVDPMIILQRVSEFSLDNIVKALALRHDLPEIIKSLETFTGDFSRVNLEISQNKSTSQTFYKSEARRLHNLKLGLITVRKCYELHPTISDIEQETILPEREAICATSQTSPK